MNCNINVLINIRILIIIIIIVVVVGVDDNAEREIGVYTVSQFGENKGHGIPRLIIFIFRR